MSGLLLDNPHSGSAVYARNLATHLPLAAPDLHFRLFLRRGEDIATIPSARLRSPAGAALVNGPAGARFDKLGWETVSLPLAAVRFRQSLLHSLYFAAPLIKPVPAVVTVHDVIPLVLPDYHRGVASLLYAKLMARAVQGARAIITPSEHARDEVMRALGIPAERVYVTPEGADERFSPVRAEGESAELRERYRLPERFLLYLGGAERRKNVEVLLRAWKLAESFMRHQEVHLVVVARFPPPDALYPDTPRLAREIDARHVHFLPSVPEEDKPALYRAALAFCFPSRYEGFGLTPLEAMASGTPVLCSAATSLPEVVGDAAWLLDPDAVEEWAAAMRTLVGDVSVRERLSRAGIARAALFRWNRTAELTAEVYREVLAR